jgi:hypothetical protein
MPPNEQQKKYSWIKAKQKLSQAELQQRIKTGSCINCGEQGPIFEACTKPKPSGLLMGEVDSQVSVPIIVNSINSEPPVRKSKRLPKKNLHTNAWRLIDFEFDSLNALFSFTFRSLL